MTASNRLGRAAGVAPGNGPTRASGAVASAGASPAGGGRGGRGPFARMARYLAALRGDALLASVITAVMLTAVLIADGLRPPEPDRESGPSAGGGGLTVSTDGGPGGTARATAPTADAPGGPTDRTGRDVPCPPVGGPL